LDNADRYGVHQCSNFGEMSEALVSDIGRGSLILFEAAHREFDGQSSIASPAPNAQIVERSWASVEGPSDVCLGQCQRC
jgi:hypothetical protein